LQNAFDISLIIRSLSAEGYVIKPKTLATLSPYLTGHLKRYGDYIVDFDNLPCGGDKPVRKKTGQGKQPSYL
jgi:hypothetical protein